jgi:NADPH:quinone reductase-like Zn-dependent oxidoreductase
MTTENRTLQILEFGNVGDRIQLYRRDLVPPAPERGDVRYRVSAFALNRADLLFMRGKHYSTASLPSRIGYEACGIVDAIGEDVHAVRVGDRVASIPFHNSRYGVAGEFAITPESYIAPWPAGLHAEQACSIWMQYLTAYFPMRELYPLGAGRRVLITAASSSAGLAGIQIARLLGAEVIAATRSIGKVAALKAAGSDHVVVTTGEDLANQVNALTNNEGVDLVYDPLGGSFVREYVRAIRYGAKIVAYGNLRADILEVPILPMVQNAAILHSYSLFNHIGDAAQRMPGRRVGPGCDKQRKTFSDRRTSLFIRRGS